MLREESKEGACVPSPRDILDQLLTHIAGECPEYALQELLAELRPRQLARGEHLIRLGEPVTCVALVCSGLLRIYYPRPDGRDYIKSFVWAPDFVAAFESLLMREPSSVAIECLVPASLYELSYERVRELQERDPFWQRFGRLFAERLYVKKARREAELLLESASQRYERFLDRHQEVVDQIPGYHVAAYLGITAEALSRIRRKRIPR
jgi:CRP-like cAMP-binding protein